MISLFGCGVGSRSRTRGVVQARGTSPVTRRRRQGYQSAPIPETTPSSALAASVRPFDRFAGYAGRRLQRDRTARVWSTSWAICATSGSDPRSGAAPAGGRRSRGRPARRRDRRRSRAGTPRPGARARRRSGWCRSTPPPRTVLPRRVQPGGVDAVGRDRGVRRVHSRFAVGKPSSRPRWSPRTTMPSSRCGRPSAAAAAATSPASTQTADVRRGEHRPVVGRPAARPRR